MNNKTYDRLKLAALIAVPFTTFVAAICSAWDVPHAEAICASLAALGTLLGAAVEILRRQYYNNQEGDEE